MHSILIFRYQAVTELSGTTVPQWGCVLCACMRDWVVGPMGCSSPKRTLFYTRFRSSSRLPACCSCRRPAAVACMHAASRTHVMGGHECPARPYGDAKVLGLQQSGLMGRQDCAMHHVQCQYHEPCIMSLSTMHHVLTTQTR